MRAPLTPIKAFVRDATALGTGSGSAAADDQRLSQWLLVAQAAERLAEMKPAQRDEYLRVLGHSVLPARDGRPTQVEGDGRRPVSAVAELSERLRLEAEDMERAGCFELALTTVSAVCQMLARGKEALTARLLATAHLGRVARQIGALSHAVDCYTTVTTEGQAAHDGPVAAHGFIGLGNVAHARGNRPSQKAFFRQALDLAAKGSATELSAHQGLMITANQLGDLADALLHGWRAHDLAPPESETQLEIVANLSHTALKGGFSSAALNGFEFVLQQTSLPRFRLPAIHGGLQAAAQTGNSEQLTKFERLGRDAAEKGADPYDVARFYFFAAESRKILRQPHLVPALVRQALELADNFGFHELRVKAEALLVADTQPRTREETSWQPASASPNSIIVQGIDRLQALAVV